MKVIRLLGEDYTRYMQNRDHARHEVKKAYFDEFGPVRITNPQGRFIAIVREDPGPVPETVTDEAELVSTAKMDAQVSYQKRQRANGLVNRAPSPKACRCAQWPWEERQLDERQKPKEHHPKCALKKMWERQSGVKMTSVPVGPTMKATIHHAGKVTNPSAAKPRLMGKPESAKTVKAPKIDKVPHFSNCPKCSQFTKSKKMAQDQHHPTCEYFKKYMALSAAQAKVGIVSRPEPIDLKKNPVKLFDLENQQIVRDAEPEEVTEGRERMRDDGMAIIEIGEGDEKQSYLLMHEDGTALDPAEPEAPRGKPEDETADTVPPPDNVNEADDPDLQGISEEEAQAQEAEGSAQATGTN